MKFLQISFTISSLEKEKHTFRKSRNTRTEEDIIFFVYVIEVVKPRFSFI